MSRQPSFEYEYSQDGNGSDPTSSRPSHLPVRSPPPGSFYAEAVVAAAQSVEVPDSLDPDAEAASSAEAAHSGTQPEDPVLVESQIPSSQAEAASSAEAAVGIPPPRAIEGAVLTLTSRKEKRKKSITHAYKNAMDMPRSAQRAFARMDEPIFDEHSADQRRRGVENLRRKVTINYSITYTAVEQETAISDSD